MTALGLRSAGRLRLSPRRAGPPRPFSPDRLQDLELWYDATNSPVTETGGVIERWDDLSGHGRHASQSVVGQRPIKTSDAVSRDVIRFDGVDDVLSIGSLPSFAGGVTLFAVFAMRSRTDFSGIVSAAAATGVDHADFFTLQNAEAASDLFQWSGRSAETDDLLIQRNDGGAIGFAILGASGGAATFRDVAGEGADTYGGTFGAPAEIVLGARYDTATFGYSAVDLYQVGLYSRALTPSDRSHLEIYLRNRYGLV